MTAILVVDDDDLARLAFVETLTDADYSVEGVASGEQALELLSDKPFDVMLVDVLMPKMDGIELAGLVIDKFPDVKIITISGGGPNFSSRTALSIAEGYGAEITLAKPVQNIELLDAIQTVLDSKEIRGSWLH